MLLALNFQVVTLILELCVLTFHAASLNLELAALGLHVATVILELCGLICQVTSLNPDLCAPRSWPTFLGFRLQCSHAALRAKIWARCQVRIGQRRPAMRAQRGSASTPTGRLHFRRDGRRDLPAQVGASLSSSMRTTSGILWAMLLATSW